MTLDGDEPPMLTGVYKVSAIGTVDGVEGDIYVDDGVTYAASVYVKSEVAGSAHFDAVLRDTSGGIVGLADGDLVSLSPGVWTRLSTTFTPSSEAVFATFSVSGRVNYGAGSPSTVKAWVTDALLEVGSVVQDYFDGSFPPTAEVTYSWVGLPGYSPSIIQTVTSGNLLVDPDCPPVPEPPKPPPIQTACLEEPAEWTRYSVLVDKEHVPRWGAAVPIITVRTGPTAGRQVRIRFYPLVDTSDPYAYPECDYEIEFLLTYLPAHAEMVIDGVTHTAMASVGGGAPVSALHLLTGSGGVPYQWGELVCDRHYVMTVDVAPVSEDMSVFLDIVGRE